MSFYRLGLLALASLACVSCKPPVKETLEFTIWHTETDKDAAAVIAAVADSVGRALADDRDFPFVPSIRVSDIAWGQLVARMREERQSPPDVSHVQPFMVPQLVETDFWDGQFRLGTIDELIDYIGPENVRPDVARIQRHQTSVAGDSATFGLAYAVGTTFIAHRNDWRASGRSEPETWEDLVVYAKELASNSGNPSAAPFILPGRDPFFIAQLVNEIVVSMGGSLYGVDGRPQFDSSKELERATLVLQEMVALTKGRYEGTGYLDQFDMFARDEGAVVPVTYGRATKAIETLLGPDVARTRARDFAVMPQPGPAGGQLGVATIDAEPWIVIERTQGSDVERQARRRLAMAFLKALYAPETYLQFTLKVPVHLRPTRLDVELRYDSAMLANPGQQAWAEWYEQSKAMYSRPGGVAPILMDPLGSVSKSRPRYLLDLESQRILSDLVRLSTTEAIIEEITSYQGPGLIPRSQQRIDRAREAIQGAQGRALQLWTAVR